MLNFEELKNQGLAYKSKKYLCKFAFIVLEALGSKITPHTQTFDPRKMDGNFLEANVESFRLLTARDDKNNENCPSYFLVFGLKELLNIVLNLKKWAKN